jgi:soluble lytic murein transglycosylase-like protein
MTAPGEQRRRAEDQQEATGGEDRRQERRQADRRQGGDRRVRTAMKKYRQPLIGLGLAGLALPMVRATTPGEEQLPEAAPEAEPGQEVAAGSTDTEDQLAEQIGMSQAEEARERQIEQAMEKHNISRDLAEDIYDAARENEIEPRLAYGLVKTESTFNERAVSHVGARGLTQVMPRTAAWMVPGTRAQDLFDRQTNLTLGFRYLNQMIDKYDGNVRLALLAYNRGPGTVDRVLRRGGNPDNGYADKVLRG